MTHDQQATVAQQDGTAASRRRRRSITTVACTGAISLTMLLAAGCGSSSHDATSVAAAPAHTGSGTSATAKGKAHPRFNKAHQREAGPRSTDAKARTRSAAPKITRGNPVQKPADGTGGNAGNDDNPAAKGSRADSGPSTSGAPNPCALVAQAQVQSFTGKQLQAPREAPLGPTCIYQEAGAHSAAVTVVVESIVFSQLKPQVKKVSQFQIGSQTAYCGIYGAPTTFVPLSHKRVLSITAPCAVGAKYAAVALPKLGA